MEGSYSPDLTKRKLVLMAKLDTNISLQNYIDIRLVEVLGIELVLAHELTDEARLELGRIRTNFNWSQPFREASLFTRRFAWELVLDKCAEWFELCPEEFRKVFGGEL